MYALFVVPGVAAAATHADYEHSERNRSAGGPHNGGKARVQPKTRSKEMRVCYMHACAYVSVLFLFWGCPQAPGEDLLDQLHKLSTKIQAQEDEKVT